MRYNEGDCAIHQPNLCEFGYIKRISPCRLNSSTNTAISFMKL